MDGVTLLEQARAAGLELRCEGDKLVIRGPKAAELLALSLIEHKAAVLPLVRDPLVPWMLKEWRKVSIPQWRDILQESIITGDHARAGYARWMLQDVLMDAEYRVTG